MTDFCTECHGPLSVSVAGDGSQSANCPKCGSGYVEHSIAQDVVLKYVCAGCYGRLTMRFVPTNHHLTMVYCASCGAGRGLVTKGFAARKQSQSIEEAMEVRENLGTALGLDTHEGESEEDLLKGLGF